MKIKHHVPFGIRRGSMKRYIAFLLAALMCTNLCACGAEQVEPEVKETPVIEEVQEVVVPTEPVMQEVSAPKEKLSVTYMGKVVEDGGTLYVNEEAVDIAIQQGRKKLKDYNVTISNPSVLEHSISDNGMLNLKTMEKGTSTLILSSETAEFSLTVETGKKLSVQVEEEIIQANGAFYMNTEEKQTVTVLLDGEPITDFEVSSSKDPLPGKSSTTIANYQKDENGRILLTTAFRGTYDFTVYHKGLSETFYIEISQYGNNKPTQPIQPVIQQGYNTSVKYDPILDQYRIPVGLGVPQYSVDEIKQMIADDLTLDEVAEKISTVADLVQYLHQKRYTTVSGDIQFNWNGFEWSVNRSAATIFKQNEGNCGGSSNLANFILCGDYDSQGYVGDGAVRGGHIYNYFKEGELYYFIDFLNIIRGGNYDNWSYRIYVTSNPYEFSKYYIEMNNDGNSPSDDKYLVFHFMYEYDGDHLPRGQYSKNENVLPIEYKDVTTILHVNENYQYPEFAKSPPQSEWPKEAR